MTVAMCEQPPDRWRPDLQLVAAILAGASKSIEDMGAADRSWVVAGLGRAGLTAQEIADRLDCSLRLIRSIRALDMTMVCHLYQAETDTFADEIRLARSEAAGKLLELEAVRAELGRVRGALNRLIDEKITGIALFGCGHEKSKVNTYVQPKTQRMFCRQCHANRQRKFRAGQRVDVGENICEEIAQTVIQVGVTDLPSV